MEATVAVGLGLGLAGLGLKLVKVPEHFGWGLLAAGALIVAWGLVPGLKPSGLQLALYVIGVAAIASAGAWQISDAMKKAAEAAPEAPAAKMSDLRKIERTEESATAEGRSKTGEGVARSIENILVKPSSQTATKEAEKPPETIEEPPPVSANAERLAGVIALMKEGEAIQAAFIASNDGPAIQRDYREWVAKVRAFLVTSLDETYAVQFDQVRGNGSGPVGRNFEGGNYWSTIGAKNLFLSSLITDLRGRP